MENVVVFLSFGACMLNHFTLCDPVDCSLPGSSVHGILQARILEWVVMPSSRGSSQPRDQTHISYITRLAGRFFTTGATRPQLKCYLVREV